MSEIVASIFILLDRDESKLKLTVFGAVVEVDLFGRSIVVLSLPDTQYLCTERAILPTAVMLAKFHESTSGCPVCALPTHARFVQHSSSVTVTEARHYRLRLPRSAYTPYKTRSRDSKPWRSRNSRKFCSEKLQTVGIYSWFSFHGSEMNFFFYVEVSEKTREKVSMSWHRYADKPHDANSAHRSKLFNLCMSATKHYTGLTFELLPNILGKIDDNDWVQREGQVRLRMTVNTRACMSVRR